jgi:hypothetical protein
MTTSSVSLPLGVCVLPERSENAPRCGAQPGYIHEILAHAGLCYQTIAYTDLVELLPALRVLVTVGETTLEEEMRSLLQDWIHRGGAWLSLGGVCGLTELWCLEYARPGYRAKWGASGACTLGEGYLAFDEREPRHPVLERLRIPLHFFNGLALVQAVGSAANCAGAGLLDAHGRPREGIAFQECRFGEGFGLLIAPDAVGAVQRIQQGVAVTGDGIPAPDGTAPVTDGVLKSDDGMVLDWHFDRQEVPGVPGYQAFLEPVADQWRELILRAIFHLCRVTETSLPLLWLYPRNLPALAHMSHDSDGNDPERGKRLLELLAEAEIHSTWCIIMPGYERALVDEIRAAGHELAMHYDAVSDGYLWSRRDFERQWRGLCELFGEQPVSNKNHYTRWEGDVEFFRWCQKRGIQMDQSKGASKTGEAGFNFGTCHPYFPVDPCGETVDVLEISTPTQDLEVFAPMALALALLDAAERHHGVLHILFHPAHTHKPEVGAALVEIGAAAKARGLEWWTASQLNGWERARRRAKWTVGEDRFQVTLHCGAGLEEATLLLFNAGSDHLQVNGKEHGISTVTRWGLQFESVILDFEAGRDYELVF